MQDSELPTISYKLKKIKPLLSLAFFLLLVSSIILLIAFFFTPKAQAREYLEQIAQDFQKIQDKLTHYQGGFVVLNDSFAQSQQAFYEIVNTRNYFESVKDTQQDIEDIENTLALIEQAKQDKAELETPENLITLSQMIDQYYQQAEAGLNLLLEFEKFQMQMLNASGDGLNQRLKDLDASINQEVLRDNLITLFTDVNRLAEESAAAFNAIEDIPEISQQSYQAKRQYHNDLAQTTGAAKEALLKKTNQGDAEFISILTEFFKRNQQSNQAVQERAKQMVENSPIKIYFKEALILEVKINHELREQIDILNAKLTVEEEDKIELPEEATDEAELPEVEPTTDEATDEAELPASPSATPELTPSIEPSVSPVLSPTVNPTLSPVPTDLISPQPTVEISPTNSP